MACQGCERILGVTVSSRVVQQSVDFRPVSVTARQGISQDLRDRAVGVNRGGVDRSTLVGAVTHVGSKLLRRRDRYRRAGDRRRAVAHDMSLGAGEQLGHRLVPAAVLLARETMRVRLGASSRRRPSVPSASCTRRQAGRRQHMI